MHGKDGQQTTAYLYISLQSLVTQFTEIDVLEDNRTANDEDAKFLIR